MTTDKKNLIKLAKEMNRVMEFDAPILLNIPDKELQEEIIDAAEMIEPADDEFSDWAIKQLKGLNAWPEEEKSKAKAEKKKEEPAEEAEEETKTGDVTESKEEDKDKRTEDLMAILDKTTKLKALKELVEKYPEFKELRKELAGWHIPTELKDEMYDILEEQEDADKPKKKPVVKKEEKEEEVKELKKEEKEEKPKTAPKPKAEKKEKKETKGSEKQESFESVASRLFVEKADEKKVFSEFAKLYKERKGITDQKFIESRIKIYMKIAEKNAK